MRLNSSLAAGRGPLRRAGLLLAVVSTVLLMAPSPEERHLSVFTPATRYQVRLVEHEGKEYVEVVELLDPLGPVSGRIDGRKFKFRFRGQECEVQDGKSLARLGKLKVEIPGTPVVQPDRALLPLAAVPSVMAHLLGIHIDYHPASRRLVIGDADIKFTAEVRKTEPTTLVLNFSAPVNPTISTGAGAVRMVFAQDPVSSWSEKFTFDDKLIPSATYSESPGGAVLTVHGTAPLLATFSNGGRTILITAAPGQAPAPEAAAPATLPQLPLPAPAPAAPTQPVFPGAAPHPRFLIVIDPGHGGDDPGAALAPQLAEKDVTLALGRRLRAELQNRGFLTLLLRDGDANLSLEQRAEASNAAHAAVYITLHADVLGTGVRVYTSLLPASTSHPSDFLPWDTAQAQFLPSSRILANSILEEVAKREINVAMQPAPVSPLNNIAAAAVAVEVAPPRPNLSSLTQAGYQQDVATAIANALVAARPRMEAAR